MPSGVKSILIWEDNPDTPLNASNLSKTIDLHSESKFIYYTEELSDYEIWSDIVEEMAPWYTGDDIESYVGKTVYNPLDNLAKIGTKSDTTPPVYGWTDIVSPYKKLLRAQPYTRIGNRYINLFSSETEYSTFDFGSDIQVFSIESLLHGNDFIANTTYYIYLYHYTTFGDYAHIKIVSEYNDTNNIDNWKEGPSDPSSPTGKRVVSYRKIGGFKTDINKSIIGGSLWDISTKRTELVSESYKILESGNIRDFQATDIPIADQSSIYSATNVETALQESKILLDSVRDDTYFSDDRFGIELKFSPIKKVGANLVVLSTNEISLKITEGYIDVLGTRVKLTEDVYLASTDIKIKINDGAYGGPTGTAPDNVVRALGLEDSIKSKIYDGLWRCFINTQGLISFKEETKERAKYRPDLKGWYNIDGARCIGKFSVNFSVNHFFIQKMSITGTYDEKVPANTIYIFHGTMCPDGLIPCDGRWHDVNNYDADSYTIMPEITPISKWQSGSWYEEAPKMWDRTIKMISNQSLPFNTPEFEVVLNTVNGSSEDCGGFNLSTTADHVHEYSHTHQPGSFSIIASGEHLHSQTELVWSGDVEGFSLVQDVASGGIQVASRDHYHTLSIITSGGHSHTSDKFVGITSSSEPDSTDSKSSWPPYKEILFCIRK